jgi:hypothetical protein
MRNLAILKPIEGSFYWIKSQVPSAPLDFAQVPIFQNIIL